ncbi:MAG: hypothetical protein NVS1B10_01190 [Candidatus Saccharimonadales bacterium]
MTNPIGIVSSQILSQQLLLSLTEELKLPLLQIARQIELSELNQQANLPAIRQTAQTALRLIDNYALGIRLAEDKNQLELEAVSVSSILYDCAQQLDAMSKSYGVKLELSLAGKYGTVLAHRNGLEAALVCLGAALIESLPAQQSPQLCLKLAAHRSRYGIVTGLYSDTKQLSREALIKARQLQKISRQPLPNVSHTSGAGVFIADSILKSMKLDLKTSRHQRLYGLGTILQPNYQLQLV